MERTTVSKWIKKAESLPPVSETLLKPDATKTEDIILELNELQSFFRQKHFKPGSGSHSIERHEKLIAYVIGDEAKILGESYGTEQQKTPKKDTARPIFEGPLKQSFRQEQHSVVGKETDETAHVERWNTTPQTTCWSFCSQDTLFFSQSTFMHEACLRLFLHRYNLEQAVILK